MSQIGKRPALHFTVPLTLDECVRRLEQIHMQQWPILDSTITTSVRFLEQSDESASFLLSKQPIGENIGVQLNGKLTRLENTITECQASVIYPIPLGMLRIAVGYMLLIAIIATQWGRFNDWTTVGMGCIGVPIALVMVIYLGTIFQARHTLVNLFEGAIGGGRSTMEFVVPLSLEDCLKRIYQYEHEYHSGFLFTYKIKVNRAALDGVDFHFESQDTRHNHVLALLHGHLVAQSPSTTRVWGNASLSLGYLWIVILSMVFFVSLGIVGLVTTPLSEIGCTILFYGLFCAWGIWYAYAVWRQQFRLIERCQRILLGTDFKSARKGRQK